MRKTMKLIILLISFSTIFTATNAQPQELFLRSTDYYKDIFKGSDLQKLNEAYTIDKNGEKYFKKSNDYYSDAERFHNMQDLPIAPKKIRKYEKKEHKLLVKAAKNEIKGLEYAFESNKTIKNVYLSNLETKEVKENKVLFKILDDSQEAYLDSTVLAKSKTTNISDIEKARYLSDAYHYEKQALLFMEYKFAVLNKDKKITKQLLDKYKVEDIAKPDSQKVVYDPSKDKFLYSSKNDKIDEILAYSDSDEKLLLQFYTLGTNGYALLQKASNYDKTISDYDAKIAKENDFMNKRNLIAEKRTVSQEQTIYKINAIQKYILANKNFYTCRQNHYYDYAPKDTTTSDYIKVKHYDELAQKYYKDSDRYIKLADEKAADEKYLSYEFANDQILTALKYQENGINIQLGVDTVMVFVIHDISTRDSDYVATIDPKNPKNPKDTKDTKDTKNPKDTKVTKTTKTTKTTAKTKVVHNVTGLWAYSYNNPTPQRASTASGTIYRVQVGASKYLLPVNELKDYEPVYYETMNGTDVKRFLVGDFSNKTEASTVLSELKAKGYTDAYIVTYENGQRKGASYSGDYTYVNNNANKNNNGGYVNATNISSTKYLKYFIQIGTFATQKTAAQLKNMSTIYIKKLQDGRFQYFVGPYYHHTDATNKLPSVKQKGFNDAIVVAYNNGQKTTIQNAEQIEQNVKLSSQVIFRVQVGAYSDYLSDDVYESKLGRLKDVYTIHTNIYNGLVVYSVGNATSFSDAKIIRRKIVELGYSDCFIISFKGDKQVPLSSVIN